MHHLKSAERSRRLLANIGGSFFSRAINLVCGIVAVPLATSALGTRDYGIFAVFLSIATFFTYADFGLGLAVVNKLAAATDPARALAAKRAVSSTSVVLAMATLAILGAGIPIILGMAHSNRLEMPSTEFINTALVALVCCAGALLPSLAQRSFFALQRNVAGNLWMSVGRLASLLGCLYANVSGAGLSGFLFAMIGIPMLISWLSVIHLLYTQPDLTPSLRMFSATELKENATEGFLFSILQIAVFAESGLDRILISYFSSPEHVAAFDLEARLFTYIQALISIGSFPLWPALRSALAQGEFEWVQKWLKLSYVLGAITAATTSAILFSSYVPIIKIWTGITLEPTPSLASALAVFGVLSSLGTIQSMAANAKSLIAAQAKIQIAFLIVLVIAKITALTLIGTAAMIWAMNILYLPRLIILELLIRDRHPAKMPVLRTLRRGV